MLNNFFKRLRNNWHWVAFALLVFLSISFLLKPGIWMFADSGFYYQSASQSLEMTLSKLGLFTRTDGFYFGYDNSATAFSHLMILAYQTFLTLIFGAVVGQIVFYFLFYLITFFFGLKLIRMVAGDNGEVAARLGALFLAFNPFALLVLTLFTIGYVYPMFIFFFYVFILFNRTSRSHYLFGAVFSGLYLLSYLRLMPIVVLTALSLLFVFRNQYRVDFKRLVIFGIVFIICASPFIVSSTFSLASQASIVNNYTEAFSKYEQANYRFKSLFLNAWAHPGGFTPSTLSYYYNPLGLPGFADNYASRSAIEIYKIIQAFFNIFLVLLLLLYVKQKEAVFVSLIILGVVAINSLGFFLSHQAFAKIHSSLLVFLYNDFGFLQFIQAVVSAFAVMILVQWARLKNDTAVVKVAVGVILYLLVSILPLTSTHYGLAKITEIPSEHSQIIGQKVNHQELTASLFAPYHWVKFDWAPYFLDVNNSHYTANSSLVIPNLRIIGLDFAEFYNGFYDKISSPNFANIRIFNLKNIFIFSDIEDANQNIDTYQAYNQENIAARFEQHAGGNSDITLVDRNDRVSWYVFNDSSLYNFLLYSPKKVIYSGIADFYDQKFNLSEKPLITSYGSLPALQFIADKEFILNSPRVDVKSFPNNPNKYLIRLKVMKDYPFLLQFNQMYSKHWKVYFVDDQAWTSNPCYDKVIFYPLSDSAFCQLNGRPIDLSDVFLLSEKYLRPEHHGKGNLIGNLFLITPNDIPVEYQEGEDLYLVIYFQKQLYYQYSLLLSLIILTILSVVAIVGLIINKTPKNV